MKIGCCLLVIFSIFNIWMQADVLRWGADVASGVPNVFYDPKNPEKITGFEYEIAQALAHYLKKELQCCTNDWEMLVPGLQRGQYDVLLNAIERSTWQTAIEKANISLSIPYYITHLQPVVLKNSYIRYFSDCEGKRIGILKQSRHAEKAIKRLNNAQTVVYDDEVKAYADLENKRLDCVLLDYPESYYYAAVHKNMRLLKEPISRLEYSVMVRSEDRMLLTQINAAIQKFKQDGTLRAILERWGLWNPETAAYFQTRTASLAPAIELDRYVAAIQTTRSNDNIYWTCIPLLVKSAWVTLSVSSLAMLLSLLIGFVLAVLRTYAIPFVRWFVGIYVECIRGTPLLIQLLLIFYGLPTLAPYLPEPFSRWVCLSPFVAGVLALAINYSAYESEVYRAGFLSIPIGQIEAARALGMTHTQALLYVIFPQTIRTVLPPITNDFIMLLQDSSLVSMITIVELTRTYQYLAATHFNYLGMGVLVALFYLLLGMPFICLARRFEKRFIEKIRRHS